MTNQPLVEAFYTKIKTPRSAFVYHQTKHSVDQQAFTERACVLASELIKHPEQKWLLWADNSGDFFTQFVALFLAGKHIIMPGNNTPGTLQTLQNEFDAILIDDALELAEITALKKQLVSKDIVQSTDTVKTIEQFEPSNIDITLFTSGTTGEAKAISKTLEQLLYEVDAQQQLWAERVMQHCVLSTVSHQHIYGLLHVCLWPFWRQAPFYAELHQYPEELIGIAIKHQPCVLVSSPTHLQRLPKSAEFIANSAAITTIFSSTGLLSQEASAAIGAHCAAPPFEIFGSTETGGVAWRQQTGDQSTPWHALPGCKLEKDAKTSCLRVTSKHTGVETQLMGDRVSFNHDGSFFILGRVDKIVKVEGKRLSLTEIEQRLQAHHWVADARIIVLKRKREEVCAVVVLDTGAPTEDKKRLNDELKQHLSQHYERILIPRRWRYPNALPQDSQGKVTFANLEACFSEAQQ